MASIDLKKFMLMTPATLSLNQETALREALVSKLEDFVKAIKDRDYDKANESLEVFSGEFGTVSYMDCEDLINYNGGNNGCGLGDVLESLLRLKSIAKMS